WGLVSSVCWSSVGSFAEFLAQAGESRLGLLTQVLELSRRRWWRIGGVEREESEGGALRNRTLLMLRSSSKRASCRRLDNFRAPTLRRLAGISFWREATTCLRSWALKPARRH